MKIFIMSLRPIISYIYKNPPSTETNNNNNNKNPFCTIKTYRVRILRILKTFSVYWDKNRCVLSAGKCDILNFIKLQQLLKFLS